MLRLPPRFAAVILAFAPVFLQQRTWCHAEVLLISASLRRPELCSEPWRPGSAR